MNKVLGCAFLCNENGAIEQVLRDDFSLAGKSSVGKLFPSLFTAETSTTALDLVFEIKVKNIAFDYQLDVLVDGIIKSLYFFGVHLNAQLLIIGAYNQKEAVAFADHMQQINNEQANYIRQLLKSNVAISQNINLQEEISSEIETEKLFNELSAINNEMANLQRELNKKNTELNRLNEIKNQFIGFAAHDLRNPLGIISTYCEILMEEMDDTLSEKHRRFLTAIYSSSKFMQYLVENLLDYNKIESGKLNLNLESFNLVELVTTIYHKMKVIADQKKISLHLDCNLADIRAIADRGRIEQVVNNLLTNAIKFSYPESEIRLALEEKNSEIIIAVEDHGKGISTVDQKELFTPFQKNASKGTSGEKGTGLGLSIVKRIVEEHNGRIWVKSKVGKGTIFSISIPKEESPQ
ncbi:MAG TPA: HAMP domain-containing sensor histidine kinase [Williamwhitmania sp.]|nr:HAMP domain-containing sensor histidine kinase [Williamwhitmania sp.]